MSINNSNLFNGAEILLKSLKDCYVDTIFGYPGGQIIKVYDELYKQNYIKHILVGHEQGAVHMAEGYAKALGKVGVVFVTSGPGATNTITGINDAFIDSVPLLIVTGQIKSSLIGTSAFQETSTIAITKSITKHSYLIEDVEDIEKTVKEAFYIASSGRPGPVLIDFPSDIQNKKTTYKNITYIPRINNKSKKIDENLLKEAKTLIEKSVKPIICAGGGVIISGDETCKLLYDFSTKLNIPVVNTLMGLGSFPQNEKNFLGMVGMHGTYEANMTMNQADLIIALGCRFSDRILGDKSKFSPNSKIIHIDIDSSVNSTSYLPIIADIKDILKEFLKITINSNKDEWWKQINLWKNKKSNFYNKDGEYIKPQYVVERISEILKEKNVIVSTDVGQHQMWTAQYFKFYKPRTFITSGGFGTMGFGLPACIGTAIAKKDFISLLISSEGSILMNIQELQTAVVQKLPIKVVLLNNARLGMVRQWQTILFENRLSETVFNVLPNFVDLFKSFGGDGLKITKKEELDNGFDKMLKANLPFILDIDTDPNENVLPMILPGKPHNEMLLKVEEK